MIKRIVLVTILIAIKLFPIYYVGDYSELPDYTYLTIEKSSPIAETSDHFLSFAIDMSQVVGEDWWNPNGKYTIRIIGNYNPGAFDFKNKKLIEYTKKLCPGYLSIGGTKSDDVMFNEEISKDQWDDINSFVEKTGCKLVYTLNAGPKAREEHNNWHPDNTESLLSYSKEKGYKIDAFRFGNELNVFKIKGLGELSNPDKYSEDFLNVKETIKKYYPEAELIGMSPAFWPIIGESFPVLKDFLEITKNKNKIVAWHYYPQQSNRCAFGVRRALPYLMLKPSTLDELNKYSELVQEYRDEYAPDAKLWLGETGHAQCGGEPGVSDRFIAGLWWLDELGILAQHEYDTVVRQTLAGSDYGMLSETDLSPNPDYWNSLLWKQIMGNKVYETNHENDNSRLRIYSHETSNSYPFLKGDSTSILLINLDQNKETEIEFDPSLGTTMDVYEITNPDPFSKEYFINGIQITEAHLNNILQKTKQTQVAESKGNFKIKVKPISYSFVVIYN